MIYKIIQAPEQFIEKIDKEFILIDPSNLIKTQICITNPVEI